MGRGASRQGGTNRIFRTGGRIKPPAWAVNRAQVAPEWWSWWDELRHGFLFNERAGDSRDLITGVRLSRQTEGYWSWSVESEGPVFKNDNSTDRAIITPNFDPSEPFTLSCLFYLTHNTDETTRDVFGIRGNISTEFLSCREDATTAYWKIASGGETAGDAGEATTTGRHFATLAHDGTDILLYIDGLFKYSVTPSGSNWQDGDLFGVGDIRNSTTASVADLRVSLLTAHQRLLTASEIAKQSRDPFGPFRFARHLSRRVRPPAEKTLGRKTGGTLRRR